MLDMCFSSREKDMNDFLFMLTATLKLAPGSSIPTQSSEPDLNELTQSSNDSDRTLVGSEHSPRADQEPGERLEDSLGSVETFSLWIVLVSKSWSLSADRTMETPTHQANRLAERCQKLKEWVMHCSLLLLFLISVLFQWLPSRYQSWETPTCSQCHGSCQWIPTRRECCWWRSPSNFSRLVDGNDQRTRPVSVWEVLGADLRFEVLRAELHNVLIAEKAQWEDNVYMERIFSLLSLYVCVWLFFLFLVSCNESVSFLSL